MFERLTIQQVREARRLVWQGKTVREAARLIGGKYGPVRCAVRGETWYSVRNPPAVSSDDLVALRRKYRLRCRICQSKRYVGYLSNGRCQACDRYWRRHGAERSQRLLYKRYKIPETEVRELHRRHLDGQSLAVLAEERPFSAETLRRWFHELGLAVQERWAHHQRLTEGMVRVARQLHYEDGWQVSQVADHLGVNYHTVRCAILGDTWAHVGGLPVVGEGVACSGCGLLTERPSGICGWCVRGV